MIGFSFGACARGAGTAFDPATLSLTGWWRASYGGSPWAGVASAGTSGGRNLSEGTNPPSVGTALNGYTPADFDGTNDVLSAGSLTLGDLVTASAYSGWALVYIDAIATDSAFSFLDDTIIGTVGGLGIAIYLRSSGLVGISQYSGGFVNVTASIATGGWHLVQWKYDGTDVKIRVDNGLWSSGAVGNLDAPGLAFNVRAGANYDGSLHLDGKLAEVAFSQLALSDADFDDIRLYVNARYGLSV